MSQNTFIYSRICESVRQQERERVRKFIEDIKNELAGAPFFLNLFAPKGFGKTAFLEQIWEEYERVLPISLVQVGDFSEEGAETLALNKLLIHIIDQLGERLPRRVATLPSDYKAWINEKQLAELLLDLVSSAKNYRKVTLLLIDDYDSMPEKQRRWFQERVLSPASRTGNVAVVPTSETELRFTESFELRMRLECHELRGLDAEAISRALPEYEGIASEIHLVTGGLPILTGEFVEQLKASQVTTPSDFQAHAQELVSKYYRTYVEQFLSDLAPDIRETMLILALLRRFDVKVLKKILPDLLPESYQSYGTADYLDLIDRLRPWVEWRRQGGYALNPALRLMLQGYVVTLKPDLYQKVNRAAEVMYRGWLESEYREHYLVELLYHVLALYKVEEGNVLFPAQDEMYQAKLDGELLEYLTGNGGRRLQDADLDALRNSLKQDEDLKNHVSQDVERVIEDLIDQRAEIRSIHSTVRGRKASI